MASQSFSVLASQVKYDSSSWSPATGGPWDIKYKSSNSNNKYEVEFKFELPTTVASYDNLEVSVPMYGSGYSDSYTGITVYFHFENESEISTGSITQSFGTSTTHSIDLSAFHSTKNTCIIKFVVTSGINTARVYVPTISGKYYATDPLSVTAASPKSTTIDGGQSIPFSWSVSGDYGTQSAASLQYSYDNANWSSLGDVSGAGITLAKAAGFFNAGTVYWRVRVKSTYNLWSEYSSASFTVKYDTPTVEQVTPISGNIDIGTAIQFKWTIANGSGSVTGTQMETSVDNGATWVSRVNSTASVTTYNASAGAFPAGKVIWRVRAKDQYANWSEWEQSNFTITAVLPVVTLTAPTSGTKDGGTAIPFNWTIAKGSGNVTGTQMEYSIDEGVTWTQLVNSSSSVVTYTATAGKFPAGNLRWRVRARDQFTGWVDWKSASITIKYDTPTVTLTTPTSGSFDIGASIQFVWSIAAGSGSVTGTQFETSVDDGITWVNRLDSNKSATSISTAAGTFSVGAVKWRVRAKDQYAGWSSWKQATITITVQLPVVTLISPTSGSREGGSGITFAWSLENGSGTINGVQFSTSVDDGVTWTKRLDKAEAQTSFTASPKTFPPGALKWRVRSKDSYAGWGAWKTASVTIAYAATSYVVQTNSPTGGNINASAPTTFACTLETDGVPYAPFTMQSATFYWRLRTADNYTAVQMTPSGANASVTISRNTFPTGSINWYIEATDSAGTTTQTPVYTISTLASAIDAQPVSPVNTVEISNDEITFTWKYASTSGDVQNGAEVRYSSDGETWTTLPRVSGTNTSVTVSPDTFHSGPVYWQVRSFNSAGSAGSWSAIVQFVAFGAPDVPTVTVDAVPFATIRWQGAGQVSYEVEVDGTVYGPFLGEEKAYSLFDYLEDGSHKARVRILGSAGLWSLWGEATFNVSNGSQAALTLDARTDIDTELTWSGGSGNYYVYRDSKLIARTSGNSFTDRTALGIHEYRVIKRLANGKYNASPIVTRTMEVQYMHIAALEGGSWIEIQHTLKSSSDPSYDYSALAEYNHMDSSEFPLVSVGPYLDENASYSAVFLYNEQEEHRRFCALFRKPVILKTSDDIVMIGFLDAWERSPKTSRGTKYYTAYTFKLQRIGWEDFIDDTQ